MTAIDALRQIRLELADKVADEVPSGWMTAKQWAAEAGITEINTARTLQRGVAGGLVERKPFRIVITDGSIREVAHFRYIGKGKKK